MLSIQPPTPSTTPQKCTPHLLPARINHNGPINDTQRYWKPATDEKGTHHAYLRGRHLHGTSIPLPEKYTGAVLNVTDTPLPAAQQSRRTQPHVEGDNNEEEDDGMDVEDGGVEGEDVEVMIAEQIGEFDEIVVWGHRGRVDADVEGAGVMRGIREWVGFAESMHVEDDEEGDEGK